MKNLRPIPCLLFVFLFSGFVWMTYTFGIRGFLFSLFFVIALVPYVLILGSKILLSQKQIISNHNTEKSVVD